MIVGLETLLDGEPDPGLTELRALLASLLDLPGGGELVGQRRIKDSVYRLSFQVEGQARSIVVKGMSPEVAWRNQLVLTRWLPSASLGYLGPTLLGVAAASSGDFVWHVYDDLGQLTLDVASPDPSDVERAVGGIAELHTRFAGHGRLGECRLWGGDLGVPFVAASLRDAVAALRSAMPSVLALDGTLSGVCDRLLRRLTGLHEELPRRARELVEFGGTETLLHGDLWRQNIALLMVRGVRVVRLVDWDHAGVGPIAYDLSTLLMRFPAADRPEILASYRRAVEPAGWHLADAGRLNAVFDTTERARIANRVIWPAIALLDGDSAWASEALPEIDRWFDELAPVLPVGERTR
jgi:hypothetical protein